MIPVSESLTYTSRTNKHPNSQTRATAETIIDPTLSLRYTARVVEIKQQAKLLLGDTARRESLPEIAEMDVEMTT